MSSTLRTIRTLAVMCVSSTVLIACGAGGAGQASTTTSTPSTSSETVVGSVISSSTGNSSTTSSAEESTTESTAGTSTGGTTNTTPTGDPTGAIPATKSLRLAWTAPDKRLNGSNMSVDELAGYEIQYRKVGEVIFTSTIIDSPHTLEHTLTGLDTGDYEIQMAAFDTDESYGEFSEAAIVTL